MKKALTLISVLTLCLASYAQDDVQKAAAAAAAAMYAAPEQPKELAKPVYWKNSAEFSLGFNQTGFFNWAAGGNNSVTLGAGMDLKANYQKDLATWTNRLQTDYGFLWSSDKQGLVQKNKDRIKFESKFAYKTAKDSKWNYSASLDFRSQFARGYKDFEEIEGEWVGKKVSAALSPAYLDLALGLEWKPNDWFDLNLSPLDGGVVICTDKDLRSTYGMKLVNELDPLSEYKSTLFQLGARVKGNVAVSINDNFKYETQLVLFYDYLYDYKAENASKFPIRVNWDNKISFQVGRFFKIALDTWMIYDPLVIFYDQDPAVGTHKTQFKEFFSVDFTYTFQRKKK